MKPGDAEDLDDFLEELGQVEVHGHELEQGWDELEEPAEVISVPSSASQRTASPEEGASPAAEAESPPTAAAVAGRRPAALPRLQQQQPATAAPVASTAPAPAARPAVVPKPAATAAKPSATAAAARPAATGAGAAAARPRQPADGTAASGSAGAAPPAARPAPARTATPAVLQPPRTAPASQPSAAATRGTAASALPGAAPAASSAALKTAARAQPSAAGAPAAAPPKPGGALAPIKEVSAPARQPQHAEQQQAGTGRGAAEPRAAVPTTTAAGGGEQPATGKEGGTEEIQAEGGEGYKEESDVEEDEEGGGWGWGGFGLGRALGARLAAATATAVKDVSELTESFQQVLQDIATAEDEEEGEGGAGGEAAGKSRTASAAALPAGGSQRAGAAGPGGGQGEGEEEELSEEEEARRRQVLARLEEAGEDAALGKSVKAMDAHVEQLSAGAGKALSSLWGWGASLAHRVEQVASTAAKELADTVHEASPAWAPAASGVAEAGRPAEGLGLGERLGQLGRTARGILESGLQGAGSRQQSRGGKGEVLSFDECFHIYGGQQAFEELEALSNECCRLCNRVRGKLSDDDKANLDKVLAALAPIFDLAAELPADAAAAQRPQQGGDGGGAPAEPAALARGHAVVADVAAAGCARADVMAHSLLQKVQDLLAPPPPPAALDAAQPAVAAAAEQQEPAAPAGVPPEGPPTAAGAGASAAAAAGPAQVLALEDIAPPSPALHAPAQEQQEPSPAAVKALTAIKAEGFKCAAEVGSLCIERLQALARSVCAQFRFGRPADDGIAWPAEPEAKALLLRRQARRMLAELEAVGESFTSALLSAGRGLNARAERKVFAKLAEEMVVALSAAPAGARVGEAFKALMYVVWLTAVDRDLME